MGIIESVVQLILQVISQIGYPGIAALMTLESMGIPVPSEIVMPFGQWLASEGKRDLILVAVAGTAGCVIGSAIAYTIGLKGGREAVCRYGRYVHLNTVMDTGQAVGPIINRLIVGTTFGYLGGSSSWASF